MADGETNPKWRRVVVKLSGEALQGGGSHGLDPVTLNAIALDLANAARLGIEVAVVVGGGNFFRGIKGARFRHRARPRRFDRHAGHPS